MPETRSRPFWTLTKIYWLLYILPLAAWFALDGSQMFFLEPDSKHPERTWFKLGVYLFLVNSMTILAIREDKRRAQRNDWRVSEAALVYLVTLGGLPGALLGMRMYRHKTLHWWLQLRMLFWFTALVAFTVFVLPPSKSLASDARWGICLFSLLWWNLQAGRAILRFHRPNPKVAATYTGLLATTAAVFLGAAVGGVYVVKGGLGDTDLVVRASVLAAGAALVLFNETWLTVKKLRGKLPGWDMPLGEERK